MAESTSDTPSKEQYLSNVFNLNRDLISLADNKGNMIIRILIFIIPILFGLTTYLTVEVSINQTSITILLIGFVLISIAYLISFFFTLRVVYARFEETSVDPNKIRHFSDMMFWKKIEEKKPEDYFQYIESDLSPTKVIQDYTSEIYSLAKINKKKFKNFNRALVFLLIGTIILVVFYATVAIINLF